MIHGSVDADPYRWPYDGEIDPVNLTSRPFLIEMRASLSMRFVISAPTCSLPNEFRPALAADANFPDVPPALGVVFRPPCLPRQSAVQIALPSSRT